MKSDLYIYYLKPFIPISVFAFTSVVYAESVDSPLLDQQRETLVVSIKQGQVEQGLSELKGLLEKAPNNQKLLADYLLLSLQHQQFYELDLKWIDAIQFDQFPEYAKLPLVKGLRDHKHFSTALYVLDQFKNQHISEQNVQDYVLLQSVLFAENQQKDEALALLKKIKKDRLSPDQKIQLSYVYRITGQPIQALNIMQSVETNNEASRQELINVLMSLGAYDQALGLVSKYPELDQTASTQTQAKVAQFSEAIKNAIKAQKNASYLGEKESDSYALLDHVLKEADQLKPQIAPDAVYWKRFNYEYMYALGYRGHHKEVIQVANSLNSPWQAFPAYVRHTLADAYLATEQPHSAENIYKSLLLEKNYADMSVYTSLYYSLIEQEKYKEANQLIHDIDKKIPTFQYSLAKGVDKKVHSDRSDYENLKILSVAYSNQLGKAEKALQTNIQRAPNNEELINNLSKIQRWREKPKQAEQTLARLNGLSPASKSTLINAMQNKQALGDIKAWKSQTEQLLELYPSDTSLIKSKEELADRNRFSISHQSYLADSQASQSRVLETLKGNKDFETTTRVSSPWLDDQYRFFSQYQQQMGDYRDGKIREERLGFGAEWESKQKSLSIMASQNIDAERFGVDFNWNHRLNDHWRYNLSYSSEADVPLQALKRGEDAEAYSLGLAWQKHESLKFSLNYQATDISDGNLRQELGARYQQNILSLAHHKTNLGLSSFFAKNSSTETVYFSPKDSVSVGLDLQHDWLTWRHYEQSLTQQFAITTGLFKQANFSADPVWDIRYGHQWKLSRTWALQYALGWGKHPYDGEKEEKWYGQLGFEGKF